MEISTKYGVTVDELHRDVYDTLYRYFKGWAWFTSDYHEMLLDAIFGLVNNTMFRRTDGRNGWIKKGLALEAPKGMYNFRVVFEESATDYIKKVLKEWESTFDGIKLRYAYDKDIQYHIIEVEPESIRRGDKDYMKKERQLYIDFGDAFEGESLLICNPCQTNNMSNLLFSN